MVHNKRIFIVFVVICLLSVVPFYAFGVSVSKSIGVEILEEADLPHELNFKIQSECTGHSFFNQATVQEDGAFAVHTFGVVDDKSWTNFEYNFIDAKHVQGMNSYAITIEIPKQKLIYYSGDNSEFNFTVKNIDMYNEIYNEVTFIEKATSHMYYKKMLELTKDFSKEQKSKIILMHLEDDEEAIKLMKENGFTIAE